MRHMIVFAALSLFAASANAGVFRCTTPNGVVYSEHPCASDAKAVNNLAKKPSDEEVKSAQTRLRNDMREVQEKERQEQWQRNNRVIVIGGDSDQVRRSR